MTLNMCTFKTDEYLHQLASRRQTTQSLDACDAQL